MRKTTIKYAAMLNEVQDACKKNERIVSKELGRKYKATNNLLSSLLKLGWIEKRSKCRYNWKVGNVTIPMAEEVADFINQETNGKKTQLKVEFKEPKAQPKAQPKIKVKPVKTETVSWFWGLYTKTVKG
jgi:hypothetical protein